MAKMTVPSLDNPFSYQVISYGGYGTDDTMWTVEGYFTELHSARSFVTDRVEAGDVPDGCSIKIIGVVVMEEHAC